MKVNEENVFMRWGRGVVSIAEEGGGEGSGTLPVHWCALVCVFSVDMVNRPSRWRFRKLRL